jgi:hypothetical protein
VDAKRARERSRMVLDEANELFKSFCKYLEIRRSTVQGAPTLITEDDPRYYGVFTKRAIREGEDIITVHHPFGISLEQDSTQCYNCFRDLASCSGTDIRAFIVVPA